MASRYSVNKRPPYSADLNGARERSVLSEEHGEGNDQYEWLDDIFCNDREVGCVGRLREPEPGIPTMYRWVRPAESGGVIAAPMYADGTLGDTSDMVITSDRPVRGGCGLVYGEDQKLAWFPGLDAILELAMDCLSEDIEGPRILYKVVENDESPKGFVLLRRDGSMVFGSAEKGWREVTPRGRLGRRLELYGGPGLDGSSEALRDEEGLEDVKADIRRLKKELKGMLTEEEYKEMLALTDVRTMDQIEDRDRKMADFAQRIAAKGKRRR